MYPNYPEDRMSKIEEQRAIAWLTLFRIMGL